MTPELYLRSASGPDRPDAQMESIGVSPEAVPIMRPKMHHLSFMVRRLDPRGANILKQEMLAAGGEAAIPHHALTDMDRQADCLISGTEREMSIALAKLELQPFGLKDLADAMRHALEALARPRAPPWVMGILNVTPDSFSDGGRYLDPGRAVHRALEMQREGADIIDIGGESTRPGAGPVGPKEQLARIMPVMERLRGRLDIPISVDSRSPEVVSRALDAGASMVNMVGGIRSEDMLKVIAGRECQVVLMHMLGEPESMQSDPEYADVMDDIVAWARKQTDTVRDAGISRDRLIIDPGIGFGKTAEHNLEIIRRLGELRILGCRIMLGASRKSFIGRITGLDVGERLEGSIASAVLAVANGADMVRVHDVRETVRALSVAAAVLE